MKTNLFHLWKSICVAIGSLTLFAVTLRGTEQTNNKNFSDQMRNFEKLTEKDRVACLYDNAESMLRLKETLLNKLGSKDESVRCYATFFLGVYRFSEAAEPLASIISVEDKEYERRAIESRGLWAWGRYPAEGALMRIGSPAITPLLRNLEESDDSKIRALSLEVINYIDNDKGISRLRLEKAMAKQSDPQKQARLRLALKALAEIPIEK